MASGTRWLAGYPLANSEVDQSLQSGLSTLGCSVLSTALLQLPGCDAATSAFDPLDCPAMGVEYVEI